MRRDETVKPMTFEWDIKIMRRCIPIERQNRKHVEKPFGAFNLAPIGWVDPSQHLGINNA